MKAYFGSKVNDNHDDVLRYTLQDLRKENESRWYWLAAEFTIDKIVKKDNGVTLYYIRRKYQRFNTILQSDWNGMQYLVIK